MVARGRGRGEEGKTMIYIYIYLEPRYDLCFDWKFDHILGGGWWKNRGHEQVPGI